MYKVLVRSHQDYCDTIYHRIPALYGQINFGVTLNRLMEKVARTQYQADLANYWYMTRKVLTGQNFTNNWNGIPYRTVVVAGAFLPTSRGKLPPNRRLLYRCNNCHTFQEIRCKTSRYKNSFFPDAINS